MQPFVIASKEPCFHCGSLYNYLFCHGGARHDGTPVNLVYNVACKKCRASGPVAKTAQEAIKGWEHRAQPSFDEPLPDTLSNLEFEDDEATG